MTLLSPQFPLPAIRIGTAPIGSPEADLRDYPFIDAAAKCRHAKLLGASAEFLVASVLCRYGRETWTGPDGSAVDRLIQVLDRPVKIQVKHTSTIKKSSYSFSMTRGYRNTGSGLRPYDAVDFDVAALVVLPLNAVYFTAEKRDRYRVGQAAIEAALQHPLQSFEQALADLHARQRCEEAR